MTSLKINEIFFSLQGESSRIGFPTIFIRLTGCPMRCTYCDTAYAFHGGKNMSLDEILKDISLSFFPGAKIGVLGLNGAGKSTVMKILNDRKGKCDI